MQELDASFDWISILVIIAIVFMMLRAFSKYKRKARKITRFWQSTRKYQNTSGSKPRKAPSLREQKNDPQIAYKEKAKSAAEVKQQVEDLPRFNVEQIIDGDTVVVSNTWHTLKIRLDSIDCPEDGQHWGDTAKYGLIKLIGGRDVHLEEHGLDHYGRTLATIYVQRGPGSEWINVNERMVTLGHAWVMRRFYDHLPQDRRDKLNRLERWARSKTVGLWKTPSPTPPWKWRREGK